MALTVGPGAFLIGFIWSNNWITAIVAALGVIALIAVARGFWAIFLRRQPADEQTPADWGEDPSDWQWDDEAAQLQHTGLDTTRSVAEKWAGGIAALLGVFGAVAYIRGPESFVDVPQPASKISAALILLAAATALIATLLALLAAAGTPLLVTQLDGWALKRYRERQLPIAIRQLFWSRVLATLAAATILLAMGVAWYSAIGQSAGATLVLTGRGHCGILQSTPGEVGGHSTVGVVMPTPCP